MYLALVACVICEACAKVNSHWLLVEREGRQPPRLRWQARGGFTPH